ncbi:MAG: hypothetical protein JW867_05490 [Candidatus Omnitrophica bacterium]|nr:hypothetical protein [Candidatus Omnitrophota bacterium]
MAKLLTTRTRHTAYRMAVTTIDYAFLITLLIGFFLYMQNYLKRSTQGKLQAIGDQISGAPKGDQVPNQYAIGLTNGHDSHSYDNFYIQVRTAGINNPTRITASWGSADGRIIRHIRPLQETWP